jgi:maltooligosyltrehalose trehalohydrolase
VLFEDDGTTELLRVPLVRRAPWFEAVLPSPPERVLYKLLVDGRGPFPDPWSLSQPFGVHGASEVVVPEYRWHDERWQGVPLRQAVIYEVHVGTATRAGTFEGLIDRLDHMRQLGVTLVELMPVASFPGSRNWGYDGVTLSAPSAVYGGPTGLRRFIDAAHAAGIGVLIDVVYNHFGPDGNYLRCYEREYFTDRHRTPWGDGINYDGEHSRPVRELMLRNAELWIRDYHADGLRLDATHAIVDDSSIHILQELGERARAAAPHRHVLVIAEDERNEVRLLRPPAAGGFGLDGVWADDFHHAMRRCFAGDQDGYFEDFAGTLAELRTILERGWLFEGQPSKHHGGPRGSALGAIAREHLVYCLQNHDQIGNRALGDRISHSVTADQWRVMSALLLLAPATPLLFMGQEWYARTPFLFFTDHHEELGHAVTRGRREEFRRFSSFTHAEIPDPQAEETFQRSRLDWQELDRPESQGVLAWSRALLALRSRHLSGPYSCDLPFEGALSLRRGAGAGRLRLVIVATPRSFSIATTGRLLIASDAPQFGGPGGTRLAGQVIEGRGPVAFVIEDPEG